ncbi:M15 family metallopeptidase [Protaetiibacter intestinalis]|uniref:D-alanyl-D-alanine carboxypeptidase family protein n=1 Tax=Protaetiibacter intestinalis TaxID=2419774 RepID=A0A387BAH7_9MICO|nr:M15 family metallopeptidase [Protaetiibacter intestinalis]AYF98718.1 D-alanyl-D-alanine carboxypeptidase family protein [Protaetiibacter intestinalis]
MTAPDIRPLAPEPTPDAAVDAPASRPRRARARRPRRRTVLLVAGVAAVLVAAGIVAALLVSAHLARQDALAELATARADARAASAGLNLAQQQRIDAVEKLEALLGHADAVTAITGTGIDPAATEQLAAARAAIAVPEVDASPVEPAGSLPLDEADTAQLRAYATAQHDYADRLDGRAEAERSAATQATADADTLTAAFTVFAEATVEEGDALLGERADAADDAKAALEAAGDALTASAPDALAAALAAYRAAVDAVVTSSDAARTPASGHIGTGVDDPTSLTVVVNKRRALPANYAPNDLRRPAGVGNALPLRAVAASAAERMAADMAAVGIQLRMSSGYRSYSRQQTIYNGFVAREGVAGADEHSARPGFSEHQTGLAADFDDGAGCNLNVCFRDTAGGRWLAENAWKYGFILRYGDGWQPTVGYRFEPWHYRYVGETVAADMHERGITTLEDYFGLGAAPDYG